MQRQAVAAKVVDYLLPKSCQHRRTLWNISTGQVHTPLLWKFGRFYFNQHEVRTDTFLNGDTEHEPTARITLNFFNVWGVSG